MQVLLRHPPFAVHVQVLTRTDVGLRALVLARSRRQGGGWFGVEGPVETGESLRQAARRTLVQACRISPARLLRLDGYVHRMPVPPPDRGRYAPDTKHLTEYAFWAMLPHPITPRLRTTRHSGSEWLPVPQALARLSYAMHARALRLAAAAAQVRLADLSASGWGPV